MLRCVVEVYGWMLNASIHFNLNGTRLGPKRCKKLSWKQVFRFIHFSIYSHIQLVVGGMHQRPFDVQAFETKYNYNLNKSSAKVESRKREKENVFFSAFLAISQPTTHTLSKSRFE